MNIKVAVRVRPFVQRELDLNTPLCVKMESNSVILLDAENKPERTFNYDHCFWSHSGFDTSSDGYHFPENKASPYADQKLVYGKIGQEILNNAIQGYNCCLFAYGQTGSGKSYSIFGYGANRGIVPIICEELLSGKHLVNDDKRSFSLTVSMLEIYNERVQDLLVPVGRRPREGLKIREHPKIGVFVEDLKKVPATSYAEIEEIIASGNKNKTLGATLMNATSSRAHTIICIDLVQTEETLVKKTQKSSQINLVDLAGSEKVGKTEATGDRLKEACSINKSLSTLGIVINQLYLRSEGAKNTISYRDSSLTRILQNSLGGNSKTIMICAISPARDNYDETLSTLRYADQAKKIKLEAHINQSETDKLIKELMDENERLKSLLAELEAKKDQTGADNIQSQIKGLQSVINSSTNPQRNPNDIKRTSVFNYSKSAEEVEKPPEGVYMTNLNEDPLLNSKIIYDFVKTPLIHVGRELAGTNDDDNARRIIINGIGIQTNHAIIELSKDELKVIAWDNEAAANIFVNGEMIEINKENKYARKLNDLDRIIFGTSTTFLIRMKYSETQPKIDGKTIDWEFCQLEKFKRQEKAERDKVSQEFEEKLTNIEKDRKVLEEKRKVENAQYEEQVRKQKEAFQEKINALQKQKDETEKGLFEKLRQLEENKNAETLTEIESEQKTKELENFKRLEILQKEAKVIRSIQAMNEGLDKKLIAYYPKIKEANAIASELNRAIEFEPFVASLDVFGSVSHSNADLIINVKVTNYEEGWINFWSLEKFESRLQLMNEAVEYFFAYNQVSYKSVDDPFWDPKEPVLFGQGLCLLKNVLYRFEIDQKIGVLGYGGELGSIQTRLIPVDEENKKIDEEEMEEIVEEPADLITKNISCNFQIAIDRLILFDVSNLMNKNCLIKFQVLTNKGINEFSTPPIKITGNQINFNFSQLIALPQVDAEIIDYYLHKNLILKLYVDEIEEVPKRGRMAPPTITKEKNFITFDKDVFSKEKTARALPKPITKPQVNQNDKKKGHSNVCEIF